MGPNFFDPKLAHLLSFVNFLLRHERHQSQEIMTVDTNTGDVLVGFQLLLSIVVIFYFRC